MQEAGVFPPGGLFRDGVRREGAWSFPPGTGGKPSPLDRGRGSSLTIGHVPGKRARSLCALVVTDAGRAPAGRELSGNHIIFPPASG
ncbi:MAG: hypothetical protein FD153_938 [Rhodospirillaceae bacterium]|nr:MAG: hypothetical protein FD153_938 [Rhodospirillaceae bacterium]